MVIFCIAKSWRWIVQQLLHPDSSENQELILLVLVEAGLVALITM